MADFKLDKGTCFIEAAISWPWPGMTSLFVGDLLRPLSRGTTDPLTRPSIDLGIHVLP